MSFSFRFFPALKNLAESLLEDSLKMLCRGLVSVEQKMQEEIKSLKFFDKSCKVIANL